MSNNVENQIAKIELKGVAKNANDKFPIRFAYSQNGNAYFAGCRLESRFRRYDLVAFGEVAEMLADVSEGTVLHVTANFSSRKGQDGKWYDSWVIEEVLGIE